MPYTYDTLTDDVIANMEEDSSEFVSALPGIINRAQIYLQNRLDSIEIIYTVTVSVSIGNRELSLPDNLQVLKSIAVSTSTGHVDLVEQTNEFLTAYWPVYASVGQPKYYAPVDNTKIYLAPTPAAHNAARLEYVGRVTTLSDVETSNWFSNYAEAAFFAAAMMYANMWTKNSTAVTMWKSAADEEIILLNNVAKRSRRSDTSDRSFGSPENTQTGST